MNRLLTIIGLLASFTIYAQSDLKIQKTLDKTFSRKQYEKCEKQAHKFRQKQPASLVSYSFLIKIELEKSEAINPKPNKKEWRHLKKALYYSRKLDSSYLNLQSAIQKAIVEYATEWKDTNHTSTHLKLVARTYVKEYRDTLEIFEGYFLNPILVIKEQEKSEPDQLPQTDSLRTQLLSFASKFVGIPYVYAGENPTTGFDCSGFVLYVYKHIGVELPHSAQLQSELNGKTLSLDEAKPGDLIFFGRRDGDKWRTQHAGIFYGNENGEPKVIHCVSRGVSIDGNNSSWDHYWKDLILFIKRIPPFE